MNTYTFRADILVEHTDCGVSRITRTLPVEAPNAELARCRLLWIAAEACHDAGSAWFDRPIDSVRIMRAALVEG